VPLQSLSLQIIDQDRYTPYYRHYFHHKEHSNYVAFDTNDNPVFVSVEGVGTDPSLLPTTLIRAFVRTCLPWSSETEADMWVLVPPVEVRNIKRTLEKELEDLLGPKGKLFELQDTAKDLLLKVEDSLLMKAYKFGVLHCRKGQRTEEELFDNQEVTPDFAEFLDFLGDTILLEGWTHYRGGLDVKGNTTGKKSIFSRFGDQDIMFHVGPFLPHGEGDQQLGKKRHIGNDICVIIFKDSDATDPLDPSIFVSDFNHIFVIVQKVSGAEMDRLHESKVMEKTEGSTYYRIGNSTPLPQSTSYLCFFCNLPFSNCVSLLYCLLCIFTPSIL
jgi:hypothetical protein